MIYDLKRTRFDLNLFDAWCRRRWLLRLGLGVWFVAIAFYFGPNRILFDKWTWITPADFVPTVRDRCVPVVRAMKAYQRKHGHLPTSNEEVGLKSSGGPGEYVGNVSPRGYTCWGRYNHQIEYDFTPGQEGWRLRGGFISGPIPYPPVTLAPATRP